MTGDIFTGHLIDAMFNLASVTTKQTIHLCGMMTEAIHTPFLGDRALALDNARYVMNTARHLGDEIEFRADGIVERRAQDVLRDAHAAARTRRRARSDGIDRARRLRRRRRSPDGGRGFDGVFARGARIGIRSRTRCAGRWRPGPRVNLVKPYGDTLDDGKVQLSFTLPIEWSEAADEAARQLVAKMGFTDVAVAEGPPHRGGFSFFVVYASTPAAVDVTRSRRRRTRRRAVDGRDRRIVRERVGRKMRVAGACIGTDAHTVGIDAILNMKGYKGDYGLERYKEFEDVQPGQPDLGRALDRVRARRGRSTRCSPRKSSRKRAATLRTSPRLPNCSKPRALRERVLLIAGGPRMTNLLAAELGYDAGFGRGTVPSDVAAFQRFARVKRSAACRDASRRDAGCDRDPGARR
jgi:beta-lysine 5,6-aminomutase beta subunit